MTMQPDSKYVLLNRYLDDELSESEKRVFESMLANDPDLSAELAQLTAIGDGVRRDTEEMAQVQDFERFSTGLLEKMESEGLIASRLSFADCLVRLKEAFHWTWLVPATGIALVLAALLFWPSPTVDNDDRQQLIADHGGLNDCIVDKLEAENSATVVFEAVDENDQDDPVTVIWIFEKPNGKDPG